MGYVALIRRRAVLGLWAAQTLSVLGDRVYALAVMWIAWEKFGAGAMGLVAIAESVPYIVLGTVGRRVVDRFASLAGLAQLDVARAVLVAGLPWTWTTFGLPGLLLSAALLGVGGALFDPNLAALVPDLVEPDQVQAVNGLIDLTGRIARVAGPGSAGVLLTVMPMAGLFWLDAATFAVSALVLRLLAGRELGARRPLATTNARTTTGATGTTGTTTRTKTGTTGATSAATADPTSVKATNATATDVTIDRARADGSGDARMAVTRMPGAWALLRGYPDTGVMLVVHACGIFVGAVSMAMPALLATRLQAGAGTYGTVLAVTGLGALAGNALVGNVPLPRRAAGLYCGTWAVSGVVLAATGFVVSLPMLLVLAAVSGALSPLLAVTLTTHVARFQPAARRRLLTLDQTLIRAAGTVSMLVIPAAAAANPTVGFLAGGAAITMISAVAGTALHWRSRTRTAASAGKSAGKSAGHVNGQALGRADAEADLPT